MKPHKVDDIFEAYEDDGFWPDDPPQPYLPSMLDGAVRSVAQIREAMRRGEHISPEEGRCLSAVEEFSTRHPSTIYIDGQRNAGKASGQKRAKTAAKWQALVLVKAESLWRRNVRLSAAQVATMLWDRKALEPYLQKEPYLEKVPSNQTIRKYLTKILDNYPQKSPREAVEVELREVLALADLRRDALQE